MDIKTGMGQPEHSRRIRELDGVRGIAILCVIYWHYICCLADQNKSPVVQSLRSLGQVSWAGVDLFFVLSGFLIGGILVANKEAPNFFRVFYLRRSLRVFPLYYFWLLLFVLVRPILGNGFPWLMKDPLHLGWYATYSQNFGYALRNSWGGSNWLDITWSLAVEEQFYLLLPLLVFFLGRRSLAVLSVAVIASAPFFRYFLVQSNHTLGAMVLLPARWDDLFLGVLGALFLSRKDAVEKCQRHPILIQILFFDLLSFNIFWLRDPSIWRWPWLASLQTSLLGAFGLSMIFVALFAPWRAIFRARWLVWMGAISYGVYMFHQGISGLVQGIFHNPIPYLLTFNDLGLVSISLALSLTLAYLSFRYFESPLIRFGHRFHYWPHRSSTSSGNGIVTPAYQSI
jgi:peptidoglycan/LPS O-acetylase OafA/YrhL